MNQRSRIGTTDIKANLAENKAKQHERERDIALRRGDLDAAYGYQRGAEQAREESHRWRSLGDRIIHLTHPDRQPAEEATT